MAKHGKKGKGKPGQGKPKVIKPTDDRISSTYKHEIKALNKKGNTIVKDAREKAKLNSVVHSQAPNSALYFSYNDQLGPPYRVLCDTNFFNFSLQQKLDPYKAVSDFLVAEAKLYVTECTIAELERNARFRLAMKLAKDPKMKILTCSHKGEYADDCLIKRVTDHRCYILATNDKDLRQRVRKIPGVPLMYVRKGQYGIERLPDSLAAVGYRHKIQK